MSAEVMQRARVSLRGESPLYSLTVAFFRNSWNLRMQELHLEA